MVISNLKIGTSYFFYPLTGICERKYTLPNEINNCKVIIENQLEPSNHDHLGKILTYASVLDAGKIVWIVKEANEEHQSAIEWLNNHTDENISFYLIEIHAYKIGNLDPAPKFETRILIVK